MAAINAHRRGANGQGSVLRHAVGPACEPLEGRCFLSAGALDTTLNGTGKVLAAYGSAAAFTAVAALPDGKVLAAGWADNSSLGRGTDFLVARFNANGTPDTSFGGGTGRVYTDFGKHVDSATGLRLVGGGKFVVVGSTAFSETSDFAVARYNANGTLDATFSGDGKQTTDFPLVAGEHPADGATAVAVLSDGKLLVVGNSWGGELRVTDFAVARYRTDGSLDTSFSGDGRQTMDIGSRPATNPSTGEGLVLGYQSAQAVAVLPDGRFLIGGYLDDTHPDPNNDRGTGDMVVARFAAGGAFDTTFGGGKGWTAINPGGTDDIVRSIAVLNSGKVLVAGSMVYNNPFDAPWADVAVARLNASGTPDTSFGPGGVGTFDPDPAPAEDVVTRQEASGLLVLPNGKFMTVGTIVRNNYFAGTETKALQVLRFNAGGTLDTSFSGDGIVELSGLQGTAIAAAPGGKTAVTGLGATKAFLARFGSDSAATASIAGAVYNDLNKNGVRNTGEPGLAGWQAYVDANNDGFLTPGEQVATTDAGGNYKLAGLVPGTYRVREVRLTGWDRTQPAGAYPLGYYDVTVTLGGAILGKNFGNKKV